MIDNKLKIFAILFLFPFTFIFSQKLIPIIGSDFKFGYIDENGKKVTEMNFDMAFPMSENLALAKRLKSFMLIDTSNVLHPLENLAYDGSVIFDCGDMGSTGLPIIIRVYDCFFYDINGNLRINNSSNIFTDANSFYNKFALVSKGNQYGLLNKNGELVSKWYHYIGNFYGKYALVGYGTFEKSRFSGIFGYIDTTGAEVLPVQYSDATPFFKGLAKVEKDNNSYIIDTAGNILKALPVSQLSTKDKMMTLRSQNEKYPFYGTDKNNFTIKTRIIEPSDCPKPRPENGKWGFVNSTVKYIIEPKYDYALAFSEGLAPVKLKNQWNFIDLKGLIISDIWFDDVEPFKQGLSKVRIGAKYSYLGRDGKNIIAFNYPVLYFSGKRAKIEDSSGKDKKYAYIEKNGALATEWLNGAERFINGKAEIKREDGLYATIDTMGYMVEDWHYKILFTTDLFDILECKNKFTYRDFQGRFPYPWVADFELFPEGLIAVKKNMKWGFVDKYGKILIPFEYDEAWNFNNGIAMVSINKKFSFIDKNAHYLNKDWYDGTGGFYEGFAAVRKAKKWGYINSNGVYITKITFTNAGNFTNGMALVKIGPRYGYINTKGKLVIKCQYDSGGNFNDRGFAIVKKGNVSGYIDRWGSFTPLDTKKR